MSYWGDAIFLIDALILIIFGAVVFFFTWHGIAKTLEKIGRTWLSIICALVIGPILTGLFEDWFLREAITEGIHSSLVGYVEGNVNGYTLEEMFAQFPQGFVDFLHSMDADLATLQAEFGPVATAEILQVMAIRVANPVVSVISNILGMVIGFLIPWLFMLIINHWLNNAERNKFFGVIDHVLGFVVGVVVGYLLVYFLGLITRTSFQLVVIFDATKQIMSVYETSHIFKHLCELNVISWLF